MALGPGTKFGRNNMIRKLITAAALAAAFTVPAFAAEPIEGKWKRSTGTIIKFSPCGAAFCAIVQNGKHSGKQTGSMSGTGDRYKGTLTDLDANKTYKGKASVNGNTMRLSGCVARRPRFARAKPGPASNSNSDFPFKPGSRSCAGFFMDE